MRRLLAIIAVLAHLIVTLFHGRAHTELAVGLSAWQQTFVMVVILVGPLIAAGLLLTRFARLGFWVLVFSMAGSLLFGLYFHYVAISPDHVAHLPPGDAQGMFRLTAVLLALTEVFGLIVGALGLQKQRSEQERSD